MALYTDMLREVAAAIQGDKFLLDSSGRALWLRINPERRSSGAGSGTAGSADNAAASQEGR